MKTILAADIGGTHSRFAHFRKCSDSALELVDTRWLPTAGAGSFGELLEQLEAGGFSLPPGEADLAVIAVAGPVERRSYSDPPYIPWDIDLGRPEMTSLFRRAVLINDFVAQAYACRSPAGAWSRLVLPGEASADAGAVIGVIGAGTALGKAILVPLPTGEFLALPSEGGHALFPFVGPEEFAFQRFYREKSGRHVITWNLVVSGNGLRYLHWFLTGEELSAEQVILQLTSPSLTLAWAAKFYGRACRDFALEVLARGGLYIAGGVAARTPEILTHDHFRREFMDSPTMGRLLASIPVFLLDNQDSGLWGAAFYGSQLLRKG